MLIFIKIFTSNIKGDYMKTYTSQEIYKRIRIVKRFIKQLSCEIKNKKTEFKKYNNLVKTLVNHGFTRGNTSSETQAQTFIKGYFYYDNNDRKYKFITRDPNEQKVISNAWEHFKKNNPYDTVWVDEWRYDEGVELTALHILYHKLRGTGKSHIKNKNHEDEYRFHIDTWNKRIDKEMEAQDA
jgi:hypothetical protein